MFRVRNIKDDKWESGEFFISHNGDLAKVSVTKSMFGNEKTSIRLLLESNYVWQQDTGYDDKYGNRIYEGDICKITIDDEHIICVVAYIPSRASYMLLDNKHSAYYTFHNEVREQIEVVGNVFDNKNLVEFEEDEEVAE